MTLTLSSLAHPRLTTVLPFLFVFTTALGEVSALRAEQQPAAQANSKFRVYIGTNGKPGQGEGIYRVDLDAASGKLSELKIANRAPKAGFLAIHPSGRFLYSSYEADATEGGDVGSVSAFAIDAKTGDLTLLNQEPTGGYATSHVTVDRAGKYALATNYNSGSVSVLPILEDGRLGKMCSFVQHRGSSVNPMRQTGPHPHSVNLDPANHFAFVADLGLDKVMIYHFDPAKGMLTADDPPSANVAPGSGPRHFAFHPDGVHAYVINELLSTVTAFDYDPERGTLKEIQTISTLPEGFKGENTTAEVQVHPSGKFLYGSNRGHNSIALFKIEPGGKLTFVSHQGAGINKPRNFGLDPSGRTLVVANQDGNNLITFQINPDSGELQPSGSVVEVPAPVCVKMMALADQ